MAKREGADTAIGPAKEFNIKLKWRRTMEEKDASNAHERKTQPRRTKTALESIAMRKPLGRSINIATGIESKQKKIEP